MNKHIRQIPMSDLKLVAIVASEIEDMRSDGDHDDYAGPEFAVIRSHEVYGNADAEFAKWQQQGSVNTNGRCAMCGKNIMYNCVVQHQPTGEFYDIGRDCLAGIETLKKASDWLSHFQSRLAVVVSACKKGIKERKAGDLREVEFANTMPSVATAFAYAKDFDNNHPMWHKVSWNITTLRELRTRVRRKGSLSEKQVQLALRIHSEAIAKLDDAKAEIAAKAEAIANGIKAPEGKQRVTGKVVRIKLQESDFGSSWKALIDLGNGTKVWGSLPSCEVEPIRVNKKLPDGTWWQGVLESTEEGDVVSFNATFEVSDKDPLFGFYKRPTKWENQTAPSRVDNYLAAIADHIVSSFTPRVYHRPSPLDVTYASHTPSREREERARIDAENATELARLTALAEEIRNEKL